MRHLPRHVLLLVFVSAFSSMRSQEPSTFQVWVEETVATNIADRWAGSVLFAEYFVSGSREYTSVSVCPTVSYTIVPWLLAEAALFTEYADQPDISNIMEIRPYIALRYTDVVNRLEPYLMLRQEFRNIYYVDSQTWEDQYRLRLRIGTRVAITDERIAPESLYGIVEMEFFQNFDPAPKEYYNSRVRFHGGLGYRITDLWSGEIHYMVQQSRSYSNQPFDSHDHILRFAVRKAF
ncbi:MAG TPA: DUF2490 domain-containing protein [Candidatus Didemnitutus sp.]|nr:DUF2490 domain-containing protein [Candidatus Didemnitutus sp.]